MASAEELEGNGEGQLGPHHVPLEPYPTPAFQAIDQQGFEYPPRVVPPAQAFEAMVRRLDLMHHATKKRRRPRVGPGTDVGRDSKASTEEAEARVGEALQSVEEAMRELLIAADLVHVIRGGGAGGAGAAASFIGQDKIADTAALGLAARGMQQKRALPSLKSLPVSHIPPEVILGMKQQGLAAAARRMADWAHATRASLEKGRRLLGEMVGLRSRARLRAGLRNAPLPRPLSAGDPLSVVVDTTRGPVVLPFETDGETGAPRLLGLGGEDLEGEDDGSRGLGYGMLRVSLLDPTGSGGSAASVMVGTAQGDGYGANGGGGGLAGAVRALEAEARLGRLFAALQREAAAPHLTWVDRHGLLAGGSASVASREQEQEEEGEVGSGALRVVRCGEGAVAVEAGGALVLKVELLAMNDSYAHSHTHGDGDNNALRPLCRLATLRLLELAQQEGGGGAHMLGHVSALVAHRRYMDALLGALARVAGKSRQGSGLVIEAVWWVDYPFAAPRSRLVLQGAGGQFVVDVVVQGCVPTLVWTDGGEGGSRRVTELGRVKDVERYLEAMLGM